MQLPASASLDTPCIVDYSNQSTAMPESKSSYWSSHRLFQSLPVDAKAASIEFVGTTFFFLLGLGGIQAATREALESGSSIEHVLYIATSMGLSLLVTAWLFYRITGGLFNPNITLALFLVGVIGPVRFVLFCIAQMAGAIAGSAIVYGLTPGPLSVKCGLRADFGNERG